MGMNFGMIGTIATLMGVVLAVIVGVLSLLLPFFVLRIRNEIIKANLQLELINENLLRMQGAHRSPSAPASKSTPVHEEGPEYEPDYEPEYRPEPKP